MCNEGDIKALQVPNRSNKKEDIVRMLTRGKKKFLISIGWLHIGASIWGLIFFSPKLAQIVKLGIENRLLYNRLSLEIKDFLQTYQPVIAGQRIAQRGAIMILYDVLLCALLLIAGIGLVKVKKWGRKITMWAAIGMFFSALLSILFQWNIIHQTSWKVLEIPKPTFRIFCPEVVFLISYSVILWIFLKSVHLGNER